MTTRPSERSVTSIRHRLRGSAAESAAAIGARRPCPATSRPQQPPGRWARRAPPLAAASTAPALGVHRSNVARSGSVDAPARRARTSALVRRPNHVTVAVGPCGHRPARAGRRRSAPRCPTPGAPGRARPWPRRSQPDCRTRRREPCRRQLDPDGRRRDRRTGTRCDPGPALPSPAPGSAVSCVGGEHGERKAQLVVERAGRRDRRDQRPPGPAAIRSFAVVLPTDPVIRDDGGSVSRSMWNRAMVPSATRTSGTTMVGASVGRVAEHRDRAGGDSGTDEVVPVDSRPRPGPRRGCRDVTSRESEQTCVTVRAVCGRRNNHQLAHRRPQRHPMAVGITSPVPPMCGHVLPVHAAHAPRRGRRRGSPRPRLSCPLSWPLPATSTTSPGRARLTAQLRSRPGGRRSRAPRPVAAGRPSLCRQAQPAG